MQLGKQLSNGASRAAGLRFGSGEAEFPPHLPSASPSLWLANFFSADRDKKLSSLCLALVFWFDVANFYATFLYFSCHNFLDFFFLIIDL